MTRLFIGTLGPHRPAGWMLLGLDDASHLRWRMGEEPLPFPDNSADLIFVSYALECLPPAPLAGAMTELRRVLRPGGWKDSADNSRPFEGGLLRIAVPDLGAACRAYVENNPAFFADGKAAPKSDEPLGLRFAQWLGAASPAGRPVVSPFDHESLAWHLRRHGFDGLYRSAYRKSLLPELRVDGLDQLPHQSLFIEAWKQRAA